MTFLDFYTLLANMITAAQAASATVLDTTVGSLTRAILQATGSVALWLQSLIAQLLQQIRAATAEGSALDTWMADFGLSRIASIAANVTLTFARFTTGASAFIPVGAIAQTSDGKVQFAVVADTTNPAFSASLNGYTIDAATASLNASARALTAGSAGNVGAGSVNTLAQAIVYVDTVVNPLAATGGEDAESDPAFRLRFVGYLASLARATLAAINSAAAAVSAVLTFSTVENMNPAGVAQPGFFYLSVDDGSGSPPGSLLTAVYQAVDAVRPFTVTFAVLAANKITANIVAVIGVAPGYSSPAVLAAVSAAVSTFIDGLPVGTTLYYTQLANAIFQSSAGVLTIKTLTINGATSDIVPTAQQTVRVGSVTATAG